MLAAVYIALHWWMLFAGIDLLASFWLFILYWYNPYAERHEKVEALLCLLLLSLVIWFVYFAIYFFVGYR